MKKYEILYDWPIAESKRLADSQVAEDFADSLAEPAQSTFIELTERFRGLGADLGVAKAKRDHFLKWAEILTCLDEYEKSYSNFPDLDLNRFRLSILLAESLGTSLPPLDNKKIDEGMFEIRNLSGSLPDHWFVFENAKSFQDSTIAFSVAPFSSLQHDFSTATVSPDLTFHFMAALHALPQMPPSHAALIKKTVPEIDDAAAEAFVRLLIIANGGTVHSSRTYSAPPQVIDKELIKAGVPYQQLNDVFNVLSEYNNRKELLTKYLTLYHVIENFMFKRPIVELERQRGGQMFSIRDFQRLYKQIDDSEISALKRLFNEVFSSLAKPGTTFEKHVCIRWDSLVPTTPAIDIDKVLAALDLKKGKKLLKYSEFKKDDVASHFAQMVYAFRNAIVHNKETEFHLSNSNLDSPTCNLIEGFLIPALEEICFTLIGAPNSQVWYSNKELLLYK